MITPPVGCKALPEADATVHTGKNEKSVPILDARRRELRTPLLFRAPFVLYVTRSRALLLKGNRHHSRNSRFIDIEATSLL